jgi:hypothetical protein
MTPIGGGDRSRSSAPRPLDNAFCFEVGCSSLGTFSSRFTELIGVPPSVYRRQCQVALATPETWGTPGMPSCVAKQVTRPIRRPRARLWWTASIMP